MTDHKFTDDDVIKALGCCTGNYSDNCRGKICPYENIAFCYAELQDDALALINRQKVEIESLKIANEKMYSANKEQEAEIERLESNLKFVRGTVKRLREYDEERDIRLHARLTERARTEAIKEFAERLKPKLSYYDEVIVDTLVKEMTEEQK